MCYWNCWRVKTLGSCELWRFGTRLFKINIMRNFNLCHEYMRSNFLTPINCVFPQQFAMNIPITVSRPNVSHWKDNPRCDAKWTTYSVHRFIFSCFSSIIGEHVFRGPHIRCLSSIIRYFWEIIKCFLSKKSLLDWLSNHGIDISRDIFIFQKFSVEKTSAMDGLRKWSFGEEFLVSRILVYQEKILR